MIQRFMPRIFITFSNNRPQLVLLFVLVALSSCDFSAPQNCLAVYQERADLQSGFTLDQTGLANKTGSPLYWSRCPAGMQLSSPNTCSGTPLFLDFDQAQTYAQDISDKSGQSIRLPTQREMDSITENMCVNPSLNTNVFPAAETVNFWTSEQHSYRSNLACTFYTYQGLTSCLEVKSTEHPFMLVIERDSF